MNRDIVGVSQTGSGKTLAYGLPILHYFLCNPAPLPGKKRNVRCLILVPTRELALQVSSHLNACLNPYTDQISVNHPAGDAQQSMDSPKKNRGERGKMGSSPSHHSAKRPPHVSVAAVVGGISAQKQRRILGRGVDVLVATPGRLWDVMEESRSLANEIENLRFLVLDEADRMIETGHFAELENILRLTLRKDGDDQILEASREQEQECDSKIQEGLQTFVFSATLSKDLQRNVKKRTRPKNEGKQKKYFEKPASTLDDLLLRLDFRDPEPIIIDLSPVNCVVPTLKESKIECLSADKDVYLYYFLLRYPGKSLVFLSSIDSIRRLMPLTVLLDLKAFPLHSQLEQRQRLKNLDRFRNIQNSILLATDIAARGLDIPAIDHVIHYQIPRSADAYVHRNGRTARAESKGFSMLMCAPEERRVVRDLLKNLNRHEGEIPSLPIDLSILDKLKYRVQIARRIEIAHHKIKKAKHEKTWMKATAAAMEIEIDSDYVSEENEGKPSNREHKIKQAKNAALKAELKSLLWKPLVSQGISKKYITSGGQHIVDDFLAGKFHQSLVGVTKEEAGENLVAQGRCQDEKRTEEWRGIL